MTTLFIVPADGTVLEESSDGRVRVRSVDGDLTIDADPALAGDLLAYIDTGAASARFGALEAMIARPDLLQRLRGAGRVPLSGRSALELDGFGTLFVELTGQCNEQCVHCYAESGPQVESALDRDTVRAALRDARELGFRVVQFTGGDPLLCPDLVEHVALARELGFEIVEIYTNGLALTDALLDKLAPAEPRFAFSFYSVDPDVHDGITQTRGSHGKTSAAIRRVVARGLRARVGIIVMEENAPHVAETAAYVESLGVKQYGASAARGVGRGRVFDGDFPLPPRVGYAEHASSSTGDRKTRGKLCIASSGTVHPCIFNRSVTLGDVHQRSLRDIVDHPSLPRRARRLATLPTLEAGDDRDRLACIGCRASAAALRTYCDRP
ncbi:MAG: radical SAM protein [Deltaproteobacteria bacterium]|nr:radical SAM protein [Deltaproteobacteria bacterium]